MATASLTTEFDNLAELLERLGGIPPERVLMHPAPGHATEQDVIRFLERKPKRLCELVDGVLVEKAMGFREGFLALVIGRYLIDYLDRHNLGIPGGADSPVQLRLGLVRIPDICFVSWKRLGQDEVPTDPIAKVVPELAIEVLSKKNTPREIALKLDEYFDAGVLVVWVIDPQKESAKVYTSPTQYKKIGSDGVLTGGKLLPGFKLPLKDLFARGRRHR